MFSLQRISLEVDRLQMFLVLQFPLDLVKGGELVIGRPHLLELLQVRQTFEVREAVVGDVDNVEVVIVLQPRDLGDGVVREINLL